MNAMDSPAIDEYREAVALLADLPAWAAEPVASICRERLTKLRGEAGSRRFRAKARRSCGEWLARAKALRVEWESGQAGEDRAKERRDRRTARESEAAREEWDAPPISAADRLARYDAEQKVAAYMRHLKRVAQATARRAGLTLARSKGGSCYYEGRAEVDGRGVRVVIRISDHDVEIDEERGQGAVWGGRGVILDPDQTAEDVRAAVREDIASEARRKCRDR